MADAKISQLNNNTTIESTDEFVIVDGTTTEKRTFANLIAFLKSFFKDYKLVTYTSEASPAPTGDAKQNELRITALAANPTLSAPSSSATGNTLTSYITATGATRTIAYNAVYNGGEFTLETTLAAGETLAQVFRYDGTSWVCLAQTKY